MLYSGKKIRALRDKKNYILTLLLSEKKILNESKKTFTPPLQVKWSVPNIFIYISIYIYMIYIESQEASL